jgi:hypothetical protein
MGIIILLYILYFYGHYDFIIIHLGWYFYQKLFYFVYFVDLVNNNNKAR